MVSRRFWKFRSGLLNALLLNRYVLFWSEVKRILISGFLPASPVDKSYLGTAIIALPSVIKFVLKYHNSNFIFKYWWKKKVNSGHNPFTLVHCHWTNRHAETLIYACAWMSHWLVQSLSFLNFILKNSVFSVRFL